MQIIITEKDYATALGTGNAQLLREGKKVEILGEKDAPIGQEVLDALPKVLAERFKKMLPKDYEVHQIELKVTISGQPFGVGLGGEAKVTFGPKLAKG